MSTKRGPGRPHKHPSQRRTVLLRVMQTPLERRALERRAARAHLDMSALVRDALRPVLEGAIR